MSGYVQWHLLDAGGRGVGEWRALSQCGGRIILWRTLMVRRAAFTVLFMLVGSGVALAQSFRGPDQRPVRSAGGFSVAGTGLSGSGKTISLSAPGGTCANQ